MPRPANSARLTRPPFERMMQIHDELEQRRYPNCTSLARRFEVSTKTIQRDIDFMRDRWKYPIEYDQDRRGFYYTRPVESLPLVTITEGEAIAIMVAQKAIQQYRGTPYEALLTNAFAKLTNQLDGPVTIALGDARALITFRPIGVAQAELKLFQSLSDAVLHSREVEFDYHSLRSADYERRRVQPWHLCCVDNQWYVIGHDLDRGAKRTFAVTRIRRVRVGRRKFVRPVDFSIKQHLGGAFGIFTGPGDHVIKLRFDAWAARLIRERFWHESQKLTNRGDGGVDLELRLNTLEEIERWVLGWGVHVEVLAPKELRRRVGTVARELAGRYEGGGR